MGVRPEYRLSANKTDITQTIAERLVSLRYTDEAGLDADVLEIVLSDHDPERPIELPPTGAELELSLGYDGALQRIGLFVVDEVEMSGWPGEMTIRARAAPFESSRGGLAAVQTQKTRAWEKGTTLGAMVKRIAADHKFEAVVSPDLAGIKLPHMPQTDESDLSFLIRVAAKYDAVVKPAAGRLVLAKRGQSKTASGTSIPPVLLVPGDVSSYRVSLTRRETSGTVVAYWHETWESRRIPVKVGQGEPVTRLKRYFPTAEMARAAAQSEMDRRARRGGTLSLTMPGRTDMIAEGRLSLAGFRAGVNGDWVITRAEHSLGRDGYSTSVEAEQPTG